VTSNGALIFLMAFLFLSLGYLGVPVAFALIASVLIVTGFTPVSFPSMMAPSFSTAWMSRRCLPCRFSCSSAT